MREAACGSQTTIVCRDWCGLADFFITDAYERSADSRTIGDGERHERSKFVATGREKKWISDENRLVLFCAVLLLASTSVLRLVKNPDHDRQRHLVKSSLSAGKGKRRREEERERKEKKREVNTPS